MNARDTVPGQTMSFDVYTFDTPLQDVTVSYSISSTGDLIPGIDYNNAPGTITLHKGERFATISIPLPFDQQNLRLGTIFVDLTSVDGAAGIGVSRGEGRVG